MRARAFLVGVVLAAICGPSLLYFIMREAPQHWWLIAWAAFLGLFVLPGATGSGSPLSDFLQICAAG